MKAFFSVLTLAVLFIALAFIPSSAQSSTIVVADFDSRQSRTNAGGQFGTWDKDPNDRSQSCVMTFAADDALAKKGGASVRLAYDVDSSSPAYNGFWLKLDGVKTDGYDALTFYIRGDAETGFTSRIKVEIKDKKGKNTSTIDGISDRWQKISIPLRAEKGAINEFTIVFDDVNSRPKQGAILIDNIELSRAGK